MDAEALKTTGRLWPPAGGVRRPNDGAVDCRFRRVQLALSVLEPAKLRSTRQIRAFAIAFMIKRKIEHIQLWEQRELGKPAEDGDPNRKGAFDDYLDVIQKQGAWATYLECFALSASLQRAILVLCDVVKAWECRRANEEAAIFLYHQETIGHYEAEPLAPRKKPNDVAELDRRNRAGNDRSKERGPNGSGLCSYGRCEQVASCDSCF